MADLTNDIMAVPSIWKKAIKDTRNVLDARSRKDDSWKQIEITAWLEVDYYEPEHIDVIGNRKRLQVHEMNVDCDLSKPIWVVTYHGIIFHGDMISLDQCRDAFCSKWKKPDQVHFKEFHYYNSVCMNISNVCNYCNKHECTNGFMETQIVFWSRRVVLEYYLMIDSFSQKFRSLRMKIGMRKKARIDRTKALDVSEKVLPLITAFALPSVSAVPPRRLC